MPRLLKVTIWGLAALTGVAAGVVAQRMLSAGDMPLMTLGIDKPIAGKGLLGQPVPKLRLADSQGVVRQLTDWRGTGVLINFWATWCPPCREEIPDLVRLHQALTHSGFAVIGVALDEVRPAQEFLQALAVPYTNLMAPGMSAMAVNRQFDNPAGMLPYSVAVNRQGRVVATHLGVLSPARMRAMAQLTLQ